MKIKKIVKLLDSKNLLVKTGEVDDIEITDVAYNSSKVSNGALFVCKGARFKKEYLEEAERLGAAAYVAEMEYEAAGIPSITVSSANRALAEISSCFFGYPADRLSLIGITGTKGKTTTCYMLRNILSQSHGCGIMGSVEIDTVVAKHDNNLTTPESVEINRYLKEMADDRVEYAIIETSAQAFKMHRTDGLGFRIGIFTNLAQDHISPVEHPDMADYFRCKMKLFDNCEYALINGDMDESCEIKSLLSGKKLFTFGLSETNDFYAKNIRSDGRYVYFDLGSSFLSATFRLSILGDFNVYNALAAIAAAYLLEISVEDMQKGLETVHVSGRMEIMNNKGITVIVDYAHNKISFENLLRTVKNEYPGRRIVSVYGCPGSKALNRRKDMGEMSGKLTDFTVITAEDPDREDPEITMEQIAGYVSRHGGDYIKIADREEAIRYSIQNARKGDVILILGKGNEKTMMYNGVYRPHGGDVDLAKSFLFEL